MDVLTFDTASLPPAERLPAFQRGAADFQVDAVGDPLDFFCTWQMLKLGEINAIRARTSPLRYRRTAAQIAADGQDRLAVHYRLDGTITGRFGGQPVRAGPGGATVWDLARTIETEPGGSNALLILTAPRHMFAEVLPASSYACALSPSPELALAAQQMAYMIDHAGAFDEDTAPYLGRALRDLFAVAMLPALRVGDATDDPAAEPLFRRICDLLDAALEASCPAPLLSDDAALAAAVDAPPDEVARTVRHFGGLERLVERRRLLAAYRMLCAPDEGASVSTIAWRCGFDNVSRFNRRFRETFEANPTDLRRFRRGTLPAWAGAYHVEKNYGALRTG